VLFAAADGEQQDGPLSRHVGPRLAAEVAHRAFR
jgi:hypothetical protein